MDPLCFVMMPFGQKPDPTGGPAIDFDRIYRSAIAPAIADAGMEPIRADEERTGGIIHKPMYERLLLCDFAVADLTTANANVFYELGVRHAARPATTVTLFAEHQPIPFDISFLRSVPYELGEGNAFGSDLAAALREKLADILARMRQLALEDKPIDSPLFQLVGEWRPADLSHLKTDVFREQVRSNEKYKDALARIRSLALDDTRRNEAKAALDAIRRDIGALDAVEAGTAIDLMLTCRALEDWQAMIDVQGDMPRELSGQVMVREQLAFALNRLAAKSGDPALRAQALDLLHSVEDKQGPSAETCGLIGRIFKDLWQEARLAGRSGEAGARLEQAIAAYTRGFEADLRDPYPGINAVTLLDIRGDEESLSLRDRLVPVVRYAAEQRIERPEADYWDYATALELDIVADDRSRANKSLGRALARVRETWEPASTADNLAMIRDARSARGKDVTWLDDIIAELRQHAVRG